jgi:hypothetical protein
VTDDLRRVAIHESGHAVIGTLFYLDSEYVTIEPTDKNLGHVRRRGGGVSAHDNWRKLLYTCGGHIAEGLTAEDMVVSDDYWNSYAALRWPRPDEEITDGAQLWTLLREHSEDEDRREAWFELAFAQTQRILSNPAVWRSVESLAARLMEKRTIDGNEARDVIEAALGRSKWNKQFRDQIQMGERYASPPQTWIDSREAYREHYRLHRQAMATIMAGGPKK